MATNIKWPKSTSGQFVGKLSSILTVAAEGGAMLKSGRLLFAALVIAGCATPVAVPLQLRPVPVKTDELAPLTFQRMIVRIPEGTIGHHHDGLAKVRQYPHTWNSSMSAASDAFKVIASETLRRHGYSVMGGDNLLFGRDESAKASSQLGATLSNLTYNTYGPLAGNATEVKVGIEWQLYDVFAEQVVLARRTEGYAKQSGNALEWAFVQSLTNLLADPAFADALKARPMVTAYSPAMTRAVSGCNVPPVTRLPAGIERAFAAVMVVRSGANIGSAVVISPDGFALTAAHVVSGLKSIEARTHSGLRLPADVLEVDGQQDVALIKLPGTGHSCLGVSDAAAIGTDLFAIGAPVGEQFAFTVTRGIVSALRERHGVQYIQTDASLNPGNSGGPLLTQDGRVAAIVSWKISGIGIEGIAFGVPTSAALRRLGLTFK